MINAMIKNDSIIFKISIMKKGTLKIKVILLLLFLAATAQTKSQPKTPHTVAIFLYPGVELLDFAGPGEVFQAAGFKVFTISVDGKEVLSQGFVAVKPGYSLADAPNPDIVVFPGGAARSTAENQQVISWIKERKDSGSTIMSVCNGIQILLRADLLHGYSVTTHHQFVQRLKETAPDSKVLTNAKYVDNGGFITTAGVSSGIDGALHLVAKIKGIDVAKATAEYIEYNKWKPEEGINAPENKIISQLKEGINIMKKPPTTNIPYEGEFVNLAAICISRKMNLRAENVLKAGLNFYPNSAMLYQKLAIVYSKLGKPAPVEERVLLALIRQGKTDDALRRYQKNQELFPGWKIFTESHVNTAGYQLLAKKEYANAIKVFLINVKEFPESPNVYDSVGEAYLNAGQSTEAINSYKKVESLDPGNENAKKMLEKLEVN
jgi:putative intracellular protease/amidase